MPRNSKIYDILISCPGDIQEEVNIIEDVVNDFNRTIGQNINISLNIKHWEKDSYPELGASPQDILNKQFVVYCDVVIAIFWTRFGTPTDNYGSGTEEEIYKILDQKKQVFLYFSNIKKDPEEINFEQYKKVKEFRTKIQNSGIYNSYKTIEEFKEKITRHLNLYFLSLDKKSEDIINLKESKVIVCGSDDYNKAKLKKFEFIYENDYFEKIKQLIDNINNIEKDYHPDSDLKQSIKLLSLTSGITGNHIVNISEESKSLINQWSIDNNLPLEKNFFKTYNLIKVESLLSSPFNNKSSYNYDGDKEIIEKYKKINQLANLIIEKNKWLEFLSDVNKLFYTELIITNTGKIVDKDIEIKVFINKELILRPIDFPKPDKSIIENVFKSKILNEMLLPVKTYLINTFPEENFFPEFNQILNLPLMMVEDEFDYDYELEKYYSLIDDFLDYEYYENEEQDILVFYLKKIKHNQKFFFPTRLLFKKFPEKIIYQITSEKMPEVSKGEIFFELDE